MKVALGALLALAAGRVEASLVGEPVARVSIEGAHDTNVLYDGNGGNDMGRISPDFGLRLKDHLYTLQLTYGGDFLRYVRPVPCAPGMACETLPQQAWNQRGALELQWRPAHRWSVEADAQAAEAFDPVGLARLGIMGHNGLALIGKGDARVAFRLERPQTLALTLRERTVDLADGFGGTWTQPGVEWLEHLDAREAWGVGYRLDVMSGPLGVVSGNVDCSAMTRTRARLDPSCNPQQVGLAHEVRGIWRQEVSRRVGFALEAGPALWMQDDVPTVIPTGNATLGWHGRTTALRATATHGLSLGGLATPRLTTGVEGGFGRRLADDWQASGELGLYRVGDAPWGARSAIGWFGDAEIAYRLGGGFSMGVAATHFSVLYMPTTDDVSKLDRTIFGVRAGWELEHR